MVMTRLSRNWRFRALPWGGSAPRRILPMPRSFSPLTTLAGSQERLCRSAAEFAYKTETRSGFMPPRFSARVNAFLWRLSSMEPESFPHNPLVRCRNHLADADNNCESLCPENNLLTCIAKRKRNLAMQHYLEDFAVGQV